MIFGSLAFSSPYLKASNKKKAKIPNSNVLICNPVNYLSSMLIILFFKKG